MSLIRIQSVRSCVLITNILTHTLCEHLMMYTSTPMDPYASVST